MKMKENDSLAKEIASLKKKKNAVILAHYYVEDEVQNVADFVGDSYYLSRKAVETQAQIIVFAGVRFMGESAKLLNPEKKVLMPDAQADCAMAHMITVEEIEQMRERYDDLAVVCYINSTAEIKQNSDICVTSSNAVKIVRSLKEKNIFFIPALFAPITFSFKPPIGKTFPLKVISPVIDILLLTGIFVNKLIKVVVMAIPAEGPSLFTAPSGT